MKNYLKVAAKILIKSAATSHGVTPAIVIQAFHYAAKVRDSNLSAFAHIMFMCKGPGLAEVLDWAEGPVHDLDIQEAELTQPQIDQYRFLYHIIDNFYIRGAQEFTDLSFYPRLEDLFSKPPEETSIRKAVLQALVVPESATPATEEFGELSRVGFIGLPQRTWTWNKQQNAAFAQVHNWLRTPKKERQPIFRLFGYAGTGKTEMSKAIADFVENEQGKGNVPIGGVLFAAYTGKACSVLRAKGCRGAETLHSFLYKPVIDPDTGMCVDFVLNLESPISQAALIIIDEASMVNEEMAQDILRFGTPILVLGDPEQLPPVKGEGYFTEARSDFMLTDIERQAAENPIIWLATRARKGLELKPGKYGESIVYAQGRHISDELYSDHDQILCGLNATRRTINKRSRRINGKADKNPMYPVAGDRLMCLRNNKLSGLYNGTMWTSSKPTIQKVMKPIFKGSSVMRPGVVDVLAFKVRSLDEFDPQGKPYIVGTQCSLHLFNDNLPEPPYKDIAGCDSWDFGYAASVHKAQGSQYDSVLLFEESSSFREHRHRHLYTGLTRAAERITVLL